MEEDSFCLGINAFVICNDKKGVTEKAEDYLIWFWLNIAIFQVCFKYSEIIVYWLLLILFLQLLVEGAPLKCTQMYTHT